jgi:hypothetical protein
MWPSLCQLERSTATVKREAERIRTVHSVSTAKPKENSMRKALYGAATVAAVLLSAVFIIRQPHPQTASANTQASKTVDARALMSTIDVQNLPRQDILSEADE